MAQWRRPPAGGDTKTPFGCTALVEVGVTVTLDFGIPKHLFALFIKKLPASILLLPQRVGRRSPGRRSMQAGHSPLAAHLPRTEPPRRWRDPASSRSRLPWYWPSYQVSASESVPQRFPRSASQRVAELVLKTACCLRPSSWGILSEPRLGRHCHLGKKRQCR